MNWFLAHLLDFAALLIIAAITYYGHKKGIMRMILSIAGFALAASLAAFVSNSTYEYVYTNFVQPSVMAFIDEKAETIKDEFITEYGINSLTDPDDPENNAADDEENEKMDDSLLTNDEIRGKLNSVYTEYCTKLTDSLSGVLPDEIKESAEEYLKSYKFDSDEETGNDIQIASTELIEKEIIRPVILKALKNVIFAVSFAVFCTVISVVMRLVGVVRRVSAIRKPDSFLGTLLGFLYSLLTVMVLSLLCSIFIKLTGDSNTVINSNVISETYLFRYIYSGTFTVLSFLLK
jgi:hypothetical protein